MTPEQPRFWPPDPGRVPDQPQPEDLLRDAAAELGRITNGEVVAELRRHVDRQTITSSFYLVSEKSAIATSCSGRVTISDFR